MIDCGGITTNSAGADIQVRNSIDMQEFKLRVCGMGS